MSYKITKKQQAIKYEPPGHFDVLCTRLHNADEVEDGTIVMGLSHFLPGGGAEMAPARFEMVYYIAVGEMTVTMESENGNKEDYCLHQGDSIHFDVGQKRACLNTGYETAQMLTLMIKK